MQLFKLTLGQHQIGYDCQCEVLVRSQDEASARKLASSRSGDEGKEVWFNEQDVHCEIVKEEGPEEIIVRDFNAG